VIVLVSTGGATRDKIIRPERAYAQPDLDRTADYLNRHYVGRTLEAIRTDLLAAWQWNRNTMTSWPRCPGAVRPGMLGQGSTQRIYVEGAAQMAATTEFTDQAQLREVLAAIEESTS